MKKQILLVLLTIVNIVCYAQTTWKVGPSENYKTPNEIAQANESAKFIQSGDVVEIAAGTYKGSAIVSSWITDNITVKGIGDVLLDGDGNVNIDAFTTLGNNITFENLTFTSAFAGIRIDGDGVTVKNCTFYGNNYGIIGGEKSLTNTIRIVYCSITDSGFDEFRHNTFILGGKELVFEHNYTSDAKDGHLLKSRAQKNIVRYNRFTDSDDATTSRAIDFADGGLCIVVGNIFYQGPNAASKDMVALAQESRDNDIQELYAANNTFHSLREAGGGAFYFNIHDDFDYAMVSNNLFAGDGILVFGWADDKENNVEAKTKDIPTLNLRDVVNRDYRLLVGSPAIEAGIDGLVAGQIDLTPKYSYLHKAQSVSRVKTGSTIDVGAYEYDPSLTVVEESSTVVSIYPNPVSDILHVQLENLNSSDIESVTLINALGSSVASSNSNAVDVSSLASGIYILKITLKDGTVYSGKKIIKQ